MSVRQDPAGAQQVAFSPQRRHHVAQRERLRLPKGDRGRRVVSAFDQSRLIVKILSKSETSLRCGALPISYLFKIVEKYQIIKSTHDALSHESQLYTLLVTNDFIIILFKPLFFTPLFFTEAEKSAVSSSSFHLCGATSSNFILRAAVLSPL